jgi:tRNA threonylcarbamoyladenosine biosynthesis protein TsaB
MMSETREWLLAMDLSTPHGILVLDGPQGAYYRDIESASRVSKLFVAASEMISGAGITIGELGLLGVGRGPGSFTGLRVAVVAGKFLGAVLGISLVAPDSLMVTAAGACGEGETVFAALDARRGEVYHALYRIEDGYPFTLCEPCASDPAIAAEQLEQWMSENAEKPVLAGPGIGAYPDAWPGGLRKARGDLPDPVELARLCRLAYSRGEHVDPVRLLPLYVRRPDARERYEYGKGAGG